MDEVEAMVHGVVAEARAHEVVAEEEVLVGQARQVVREEVPPSPQVFHRS